MNGVAQSGLEVALYHGLEVVPQSNVDMCFVGSSQPNEIALGQPDKSINTVSKIKRNKALWALAVIAIVCLAAALGAGLGAGLANRHVSIKSR